MLIPRLLAAFSERQAQLAYRVQELADDVAKPVLKLLADKGEAVRCALGSAGV